MSNSDDYNPWGKKEDKPSVVKKIPKRSGGGGSSRPPEPQDILVEWLNKPIFWVGLSGLLLAGWLLSGFYRVDTDSQGVVTRFGEYHRTDPAGLNYHLPYPIEQAQTLQVTKLYRTDIDGSNESSRFASAYKTTAGMQAPFSDLVHENLMLTGDENIVNLKFSVMWRIKDARGYLFRIQNPFETLRSLSESIMREIVSQNNVEPILTESRGRIEDEVRTLLQASLDRYETGIDVTQIAIQESQPPVKVIEAFRDVQAARADQERMRNEAEAYANKIIPEARGDAEKIRQEADAYKQRVTAESEGEAVRFTKIYNEYKEAKTVTKERMYWEAMEDILKDGQKIILDSDKSNLPVLPVNLSPVPVIPSQPVPVN